MSIDGFGSGVSTLGALPEDYEYEPIERVKRNGFRRGLVRTGLIAAFFYGVFTAANVTCNLVMWQKHQRILDNWDENILQILSYPYPFSSTDYLPELRQITEETRDLARSGTIGWRVTCPISALMTAARHDKRYLALVERDLDSYEE